jgi:hypothetical protein
MVILVVLNLLFLPLRILFRIRLDLKKRLLLLGLYDPVRVLEKEID